MKVELFTLCDFANADAKGKMNIIGSFDHIFGIQVPIVHVNCALALKMRFERGEEGAKRMGISFIDADGKAVLPSISIPIRVQFSPDTPSTTVPISVMMPQICLPRFGEYSIGVAIDARLEASIPLYARQIQLPFQAGPPAQVG